MSRNDHAPGAQGHDAALRAAISKLQEEHAAMMGNQADSPFQDEMNNMGPTEKLYQYQGPKAYADNRNLKRRKPRRTRRYGAENGDY